MTKELVATSSRSHPLRALPNDAPSGTLRIIIWHTFGEREATGTWCTGPHGSRRDEWWPRDVPALAIHPSEARWEYDGFNLSSFEIGYHAGRFDESDPEFREILRQLDSYARRRGWERPSRRAVASEQQALDRAVCAANHGWNDASSGRSSR